TDPASTNHTTAAVDLDYTNGQDPTHGYLITLRTFNQPQTINPRPGYDDVTGLGTPNGFAFVTGLAHGAGLHPTFS
ncbi:MULTISPECIES: hypothetical protein, partial [unclassified Frankia]|uniref:hypothetical protein n=1 Tax=unclassified Frankia TaxID=2632575 RepID=UPI002AD2AFC8